MMSEFLEETRSIYILKKCVFQNSKSCIRFVSNLLLLCRMTNLAIISMLLILKNERKYISPFVRKAAGYGCYDETMVKSV